MNCTSGLGAQINRPVQLPAATAVTIFIIIFLTSWNSKSSHFTLVYQRHNSQSLFVNSMSLNKDFARIVEEEC